ncbi:hypothetical protein EMIHUDRAFT_211161 [Emiliania huxleyi CCMP1516]|uniref:Sister chromatid cohesion protein DCC1 n=2 Tax=Emiliania huxleyi TaxID=2903 RepID=A0A0D3IWI6_EMIH1|nr:hypothetical protein EMIHUDRAFT_211161 [Emiliania huxleyi CCMP1516]EOD15621.1 hypothetical protein EMIHUDRAFT_211161 [Emiliania huxleyi CCMP1516]|eukprot:XP_005768050.1 hypothetical protein EMIHUDRAFT_211161 [Emiliania huxleyi CCMP1516]
MPELLSDGGSVCIKGCGEDEAVLTTHDASYVVRLADSSNSMLLVRGGVEAEEALDEPAVGEEEALAPSRPDARPTLSSLEAAAQCSPLELRAALQRWRAVEVAGRWCCLDPQYEADCVECLLALAVEQEWPLHAVPVPAAVEALAAQFDEATVRHCLRSHSTAAAAPWEEWLAAAASDEVALEPRAICTFRARVLLLETEAWPKDAFDEAWADGPSDADLDGLAVLLPPDGRAAKGAPLTVRALSAEAMPPDAAARFSVLWSLKPSWAMRELGPYLLDIVAPGSSAEALVLQHARCVTASDGSRSYVERK